MVRQPEHVAPYRRIANALIEKIKSGDLQPGDRIPSSTALMKAESISTATSARVLGVLRDEGWIDTVPGRGSFVRTQAPLTQGASRIGMVRQGGSGLLDGETVEFVEAHTEQASQEVADALGVEVGDDVVLRRRRYADAAGVSVVSTTWVTAALAAELPAFTEPGKLPKMTMGYIEDQTGRKASQQRETHSVGSVPEDIAPQLGTEAGDKVLKVTNRYVDQDGEPTEYAVDWHAPGRSLVAEGPVE
ncbi:GntR family transcriptional regulator [Streptomyces sp. TX20-6-3]|uniref:GntR family transcriptional regulator n=1 Tax=Streptomyces sp. TX20-6-3 TaxID=3028705 RepID=UPI0029B97155|nr:GntR family transcriptional regulator [Streptomyces sp. TX20-6-3]MDX2560482.1 GntR family transcriptional regulator [Streptomyces sp. TX20-6-3]